MKVFNWFAVIPVAVLTHLFATTAVAQTQEGMLEEVTVTAQKREQSIQEVAISIVAFGSEELERRRILSVSELTEHVANVEMGLSPDNEIPIFTIRGVGLQDYNANNTPTTALVVDDVYQPYGIFGAFNLFDTERVEILRGPQGGLYGRNSTGGAVNIVSRKPGFDNAEGNTAFDVGNYGTLNFRGGASVPFGETFAARFAAQYDGSDGYYYNTYLNRDVGGKDKLQTRLTLSFAPIETFSADLRLTYGRDKSEVSLPELAGYLDPDTRLEGPWVDLGGPAMNVPFTPEGDPVYCDAVLATGIPDGTCINANGWRPDGDPYSGPDSEARRNDDTFKAVALNLNFDFERMSLVSVTSFTRMDFFHTNNIGSLGIAPYQNPEEWIAFGRAVGRLNGGAVDPNYVTRYNSDIDAWSQEFRLLSNSGGPFSWMLGAVYQEDDLHENRNCEFPANLFFDWNVFPGCGTMIYDQTTEVWSVYGQLVYQLSDRFELTLDGRYTREKKTYDGGVWINDGPWACLLYIGVDPDTCMAIGYLDPVTNLFPLAVGAHADYDEKDPSFKANLNYSVSDNALLYFSVGQTFKSGGFFGGFFFSPDAIVAYRPETNLAYELGMKSTWAGGRVRLNGAVFRYDYTDFQGNLNAQSKTGGGGGAVFSGLTNLGDVETTGAELDLTWLPTDGLTLGLGLGWLDTEITAVADQGFTDPDIIVGVTNILAQTVEIVGNELNRAPQTSGNAFARYEFGLTESVDASLQVEANWTDDYYLSVSNEPWSREGGVTLLNASAQFFWGADRDWSLTFWGRNLTDETYRTSYNDDGIFDLYTNWSQPRTYGLTLAYTY